MSGDVAVLNVYAGIRHRMRHLKRWGAPVVKIKRPEKYLHAAARRRQTEMSQQPAGADHSG